MPPTSPNRVMCAKAARNSPSIASSGPSSCCAITTITRASSLGHYPTDAALGLEGGKTPALARLVCLEGADQDSYQQAEEHLKETGGIHLSARQIQRLVQQVGAAAQTWQEREALEASARDQARADSLRQW